MQVTWRWQPFSNPARADTLALEHWVKCYKDQTGSTRPAEEGEYSFAKLNKKVQAAVLMLSCSQESRSLPSMWRCSNPLLH